MWFQQDVATSYETLDLCGYDFNAFKPSYVTVKVKND